MNRSVMWILAVSFLLPGCLASRQAELDKKRHELEMQVLERQNNEKLSLMPNWLHDRPDGKKGMITFQKDNYECERDVNQTFPSRSVFSRDYVLREMDRHRMYMQCMRVRDWTEQKKEP